MFKSLKSKTKNSLTLTVVALSLSAVVFAAPVQRAVSSSCESRKALCPFDPTLKSSQSFCEVDYNRSKGKIFCGPSEPFPICNVDSCSNKSVAVDVTSFNASNTCASMQNIIWGNLYSNDGDWKPFARFSLALKLGVRFEDIEIGTSTIGKVRYFFYLKDGVAWAVILGTQKPENWVINLQSGLVNAEELNMPLHRGYYKVAKSLLVRFEDFMHAHPALEVNLTGHSLGGAVATILGLLFEAKDKETDSVVTFGQPQITDASGAEIYQSQFEKAVRLMRFVNLDDMVPFAVSWLKKEYTQFGFGSRIGSQTKDEITVRDFALLLKADNTRVNFDSDGNSRVDHHHPDAYVASLNALFCDIQIK